MASKRRKSSSAIARNLTLLGILLCELTPFANADLTLDLPGYSVQLFATGIGASDGMALSPSGDLFVTDYGGGRILEIPAPFTPGVHSYQVYATGISFPVGVAFNNAGDLFVASSTSGSSNILQVASNGQTSVFASGFSFPSSIAAYGNNLYVTDSGDGTIKEISPSGGVQTVLSGYSSPNGPYGISFDNAGDLYFTVHSTGAIYEMSPSGSVQQLGTASPLGVSFTAVGPGGTLFVADGVAADIITHSPSQNVGVFTTFASGFVGMGSPPAIGPTGIVFDSAGDMFVGDGNNIWLIEAVPEPASWLPFLLGLVAIAIARLRRLA